MKVAELATKLNTTVEEVFRHYKKIFIEIPEDQNYILSPELIRKAIPNYRLNDNDDVTINSATLPTANKLSENEPVTNSFDPVEDLVESRIEEKRKKRLEILNNLQAFFKSPERELTQKFKQHNTIDTLLLEGRYRRVPNQNFGYFEDITTQDGKKLLYPVSNDLVGDIFIRSGELVNGKRYVFEAMLTSKFEREKHNNPFLLQAKPSTVKEIIRLSALETEIKSKENKLQEIKQYLDTAEEQFAKKKEEIEEKARLLLQEKQIEADKAIEGYNLKITDTYQQLQLKEQELQRLNEAVQHSSNNLSTMEKLLSTLKQRISLCRNLQFISEQEENKYLNLLSDKAFEPEGHLNFEQHLDKSFSKLADHIHAYLFQKKHLIYTRYQIRNFLTLLKTHDIVVLSGLSGSGKTQIVKAFAEAIGGVAKIIPVKPNWTSSDDLIGYYNPIQMSFLPTPFTEAIVEAIQNPNQLYLICLDEMNLARAEYYFADFLSKLEERSRQPEIELYANHEEELFISEFNTLLNLIESSINGQSITSWQEFLDNEEARKKFFDRLGNTDKESMLQLHAKMKRRLIDILKFPSTIKIPPNVRFIGAINVDETTHYFSPKILDRIHVVKFENPLVFEQQVKDWFVNRQPENELLPVYVHPNSFSMRSEYPHMNLHEFSTLRDKLKEINEKFLLQLNIDFGIRSIRQSLNYSLALEEVVKYYYYDLGRKDLPNVRDHIIEDHQLISEGVSYDVPLNGIIIQKILPRFIFDGSEIAKNGKTKLEIAEEFQKYLSEEFATFYYEYETDAMSIGRTSSEFLQELIEHAKRSSNSQVNFFA